MGPRTTSTYTISRFSRQWDHQASYTSRTLSSDSLLSHPPPPINLKAPPLSFWDISVASDLQRQGQRQPHQTPPAVEQLYRDLKKGSHWWISFFPQNSFCIFLSHFLFSSNYLNVLSLKKLVQSLSSDIRACLAAWKNSLPVEVSIRSAHPILLCLNTSGIECVRALGLSTWPMDGEHAE